MKRIGSSMSVLGMVGILLAAIPGLAQEPAAAGERTPGGWTVARELLLEGGDEDITRVFVCEDRSRVAVTLERDERTRVWAEGLGYGDRKRVFRELTFSPGGERVGWTEGQGGDVDVVVDGEKIGSYGMVVNDRVVFSPDGRRYGFLRADVKDGEARNWYAMIDGRRSERYDNMAAHPEAPPIVFSPDGEHAIYFAGRGGRNFAVLDGERGPEFDGTAGFPLFTPDGTEVLYLGVRDDQWYAVVNSELHGPFDFIRDPAVSATGEFAYAVERDGRESIVRDHEAVDTHVVARAPVFSPDGSRLAYAVQDSSHGDSYIVCDGVARPAAINSRVPAFTADGVLYWDACVDSTGLNLAVMIEGREALRIGGLLDFVHVTFAPGGERFACAWRADIDTMRVVVDGVEYSDQPFAGPVVFSPDGGRFAFRTVGDDGAGLNVDGEYGPPLGVFVSDPVFSPDGRSVACVAAGSRGDEALVVDGIKGESYERIRPREPVFEADGALICYAVDHRNDLYRITLRRGNP